MEIIKAKRRYSKEISKLMLNDLKKPHSNFPKEMIIKLKEHAKEENILKEFENPKIIAFLAIEENNLLGFIVGYEEDSKTAMIHYITTKKAKIKEKLLNKFIKECKIRNLNRIITDAFEFMDNNNFFISKGFILTKKEKLAENLVVLWYKLDLN